MPQMDRRQCRSMLDPIGGIARARDDNLPGGIVGRIGRRRNPPFSFGGEETAGGLRPVDCGSRGRGLISPPSVLTPWVGFR
jgi:hypothetical protein